MDYNDNLKDYYYKIERQCVRTIQNHFDNALVLEFYEYWKSLDREVIISNMLSELKENYKKFWTNPKFNQSELSLVFLEWGGISSGYGVEAYGCTNDKIGIPTTGFYAQYDDYETDSKFETIPTFTLFPLEKLYIEHEKFDYDDDSEYSAVFDLLVNTSYLLAQETFLKFSIETNFDDFNITRPFKIAIQEHDTGNSMPLLILT